MLRKGVCFLLLIAMMLHCASRVGAISWLYQKRHAIAFSIGMIAEIPIAICSSHYDFEKALTIDPVDDEQKIPLFAHAQEISLFIVPVRQTHPITSSDQSPQFFARSLEFYSLEDSSSIFHPPLL